jgi:hypothetical protein
VKSTYCGAVQVREETEMVGTCMNREEVIHGKVNAVAVHGETQLIPNLSH